MIQNLAEMYCDENEERRKKRISEFIKGIEEVACEIYEDKEIEQSMYLQVIEGTEMYYSWYVNALKKSLIELQEENQTLKHSTNEDLKNENEKLKEELEKIQEICKLIYIQETKQINFEWEEK